MHYAFDPAMVHELSLFIASIAYLIETIWPKGVFR